MGDTGTEHMGYINKTSEDMIETSDGPVSLSRLLHNQEMQRKEAANLYFKNMLIKMSSKRAEMMNKFWHKQELEYERSARVRRNREMEILKEWELDDRITRFEQEELSRENREHADRMRNILEKQLQSTKLFEHLNNSYSRICENHETIAAILCSDKNFGPQVFNEYESKLSAALLSTNALIEKCKSGVITSQDVANISALDKHIQNLKKIITEELSKTKIQPKEPEAAPTSPAVTFEPESPAVAPALPVRTPQNTDNVINRYYDKKSYAEYLQLKEYLINYENGHQELSTNPALKKFRFECQKAVNTPINALSSLNSEHIKDKYDKLCKLLSGETVIVGNNYISAAQHPQGISYCKSLLASKIVQQGELLVSSNHEAAFPLASVSTALWAKFPDFGKLLLCHFQKRCPYLVPMMMPQTINQSDEDFYRARGYVYDDNGTIEKQDKFLKRMTGIFRLYSAIWVTKMPHSLNIPHPQNLSFAWRWLAKFVKLNPEVDLSATLLYDFVVTCGFHCHRYYQSQFIKVLKFLLKDYLEQLDKIDSGGPKTRLDVLILDIINNGKLLPPKGLQTIQDW